MLRGNLLKLAKGYSRSSITHTAFKKSLPFSNAIISRTIGVAKFSTSETPNGSDKEAASAAASRKEVSKFDPDEYDDYDEPKTAGEKVRWYTRYILGLIFLGSVVSLSMLVFSELFGSMQPGNIASRVFEILRIHDDIVGVTGDNCTMYGKETGRKEGRRNQIENRQYVEEDGSKRTRIRFNVKGPRGHFLVWVEVSDKMESNEYVYIICKDAKTGRVVTIQDNRDRLMAEMAMPTVEGGDALTALLGGFGIKR